MQRRGWRQSAIAVLSMLLSGLAPGACATSEVQGQAQIEEFSPQGRVSAVKAVQLRMSTSAVAFGDPHAHAPVILACEGPVPEGQGRWLDDTRWVYSFDAALPAGVRCVAHPNPGFRGIDGGKLPFGPVYQFDTGAPAMVDVRPHRGQDIDEEQIFILRFDGPVDPSQVARQSHCVIGGVGERIPMRVVPGGHRDELMAATYMVAPEDMATVVLLQCARALPPGSEVKLEVGPGIRAVGQPLELAADSAADLLEYKVRAPFTARLSCTRERAGRPCLPVTPVSILFSAAVPRAALEHIRLSAGDVIFEAEAGDDAEAVTYLTYRGPFPAGEPLTLTLPEGLRDDAGRVLANAGQFPMAVEIAGYPPLAKFASGTFGVVERFAHSRPGASSAEAAAVPVTLRHIEASAELRGMTWSSGRVANLRTVEDAEVLRWYARLQRLESGQWSDEQLQDIIAGRAPRDDYGRQAARVDVRSVSLLKSQASAQRLSLPAAPADAPRPFEVVGVPLSEPGFHVLEIESPRLGASLLKDGGPMYVRTGVLLTNLALHVKQGRDDLFVWVTTLAGAKSVAGADISVLDCNGRRVAEGRSDAGGIWHHRVAIDAPDYCPDTGLEGLFVSARIPADHPDAYGAADYTFVLSGWDRGIENWRFNVPTSSDRQPELLTHTVFDRSLFRAGETVSMKHFLREELREGLQVPVGRRPDRLLIEHEGSSQLHELSVQWQDTPSGGLAALSHFAIPESAHLGSYVVRLTDKDGAWYGSSRFRVEEFRLPLLSGQLDVRGGARPGLLVAPQRLDVDIQLAWLSGGAAAGQQVQLSAVASDHVMSAEGYGEYSFAPPPRLAASQADAAAGWDAGGDAEVQRRLIADAREVTLGVDGTATLSIDAMPLFDRAQQIRLEASFADPNGEIQTLSRAIEVWPSAVQAGVQVDGWDRAGKDIPVSLLALGADAQPQQAVPMELVAVERKTYTVRKRMVGGFYRYESHTERQEIGTVCRGETDAEGVLSCSVNLDRTGAIELHAVATDKQGRASRAYTTLWLSGQGELWFGGHDDDRIDLTPARREWVIGDEAEFQVRMPFREAVALLTVEREGVLWAKQVTLTGENPVVKIPVAPEWTPNVYVSVLVLRGRLYELPWQSFFEWGWRRPAAWLQAYRGGPEDMPVTSTIDLAKPAFRYGLAEIRVNGTADQLRVEVLPDRDVFKVRDEAGVRLRVRLPDGSPAVGGTVAFAAVDEALLELSPNQSWSIHDAMHPRRNLAVRTATTQLEVVGRRHYGRKAVAAGGGGGAMPTRQLFDTLLSWQPMVQLDANGEAEVHFSMNDALSRFRLVAVADHGAGYFGVSEAVVTTRQDLQLVPGLPSVVREGDHYLATVTLRNLTPQPRAIDVRVSYSGHGPQQSLPTRTVRLAANEAATVSWRVSVPELSWPQESAVLHWRIEASDGSVGDSLAMAQRIEPRVSTATVQASLLSLEAGESAVLPVHFPEAALRDEAGRTFGGIVIETAASLLDALPSVQEWWQQYPYTCLEQSASQAIALGDAQRWRKVLDRLSTHADDDGLLRYFPGNGPGSVVLTAYLVSISDEAQEMGGEFALPAEILSRMLDGLQAFAEGRLKREPLLADTNLDARRMMAMEALARHGRVTADMLSSFNQTPEKWPSATVVDWVSILERSPDWRDREQHITQARRILISRMSVSGTSMAFTDSPPNMAPGLMATPVTSQARLMLAVMARPEWQDDLPRLARGLLDARSRGVWAITTDNLLATMALQRFSEKFEGVPATGPLNAVTPEGAAITLTLPSEGGRSSTRLNWPRSDSSVSLSHEGQGRAWIDVRAQARVSLTQPQAMGYRVERRMVPVQRHVPGRWSRGDVYRVELEIHARDSAAWVVINDPLPAGASVLGSGLGRDASGPLAEQTVGYYAPAFVERGATTYRAYFDYLPAGRVKLAYTVRLNAVGSFVLPPTRIEALYQPDLYGSFPNADGITVDSGPFDGAR